MLNQVAHQFARTHCVLGADFACVGNGNGNASRRLCEFSGPKEVGQPNWLDSIAQAVWVVVGAIDAQAQTLDTSRLEML